MSCRVYSVSVEAFARHQLTGELSTFIFAAMDTTSNALSIILQLLAEHEDVQEKLRQEILEASKGEDLEYDALVSLPYLDAVCRETLRLCVTSSLYHLRAAQLTRRKYFVDTRQSRSPSESTCSQLAFSGPAVTTRACS